MGKVLKLEEYRKEREIALYTKGREDGYKGKERDKRYKRKRSYIEGYNEGIIKE